MDHLHHFGLNEDPFRSDPLERFGVASSVQADALRRVDRAVRQTRGVVALLGGVGSGKTTIARRLYEELEEEIFEASMMMVLRGKADADWLLERFARELSVDEPSTEREALIAQIYERLAIIREDGRHAVLIVDDAHGLASVETLAEVFGLVKLEYEERRLLTIVLAGGPPLARALFADALLAHHLDVVVNLLPFDRDEVAGYLSHRIQVAGGDPRLLLPGAVAGLHELSGGWPGLLNTLADNALFEAYLAGRTELTRSDVERAHSELGWAALRNGAVGSRPAAASLAARAAAVPRAPGLAETTNPEVADLDSELEAVFEPDARPTAARGPLSGRAEATMLMDFDSPEATAQGMRPLSDRSMAAPTEIQLEASDAIEPPPKADEVDDLFMELLDD